MHNQTRARFGQRCFGTPTAPRNSQTSDQGALVSVFPVANELGHGGATLVRRVYGYLGQVRHRSETVEYRVQQHRKRLGEQLRGETVV